MGEGTIEFLEYLLALAAIHTLLVMPISYFWLKDRFVTKGEQATQLEMYKKDLAMIGAEIKDSVHAARTELHGDIARLELRYTLDKKSEDERYADVRQNVRDLIAKLERTYDLASETNTDLRVHIAETVRDG